MRQTAGITTTRYVLDPAAGLTQVLADGTNTYLYGNGRLAQYQAEMQYFGADGLGSVRQMYDASGLVAANNRYDPYGSVMSHYGDATTVFGFTGEQWDAATGLEYLRARYYSSAQGRFFQQDPFTGRPESPSSLHKYLYASNDPVRRIDPSGRDSPLCDNVFDCEVVSGITSDFPSFLGGAGYQFVNDQFFGIPDWVFGSEWKPKESYSFWLGQQGGRRASTSVNAALVAKGAADVATGSCMFGGTAVLAAICAGATGGACALVGGGALAVEGGLVLQGVAEGAWGGGVLYYQSKNPLPPKPEKAPGRWAAKSRPTRVINGHEVRVDWESAGHDGVVHVTVDGVKLRNMKNPSDLSMVEPSLRKSAVLQNDVKEAWRMMREFEASK